MIEGKQRWARRLGEKRRDQGLPLPSVDIIGHDGIIFCGADSWEAKRNSGSSSSSRSMTRSMSGTSGTTELVKRVMGVRKDVGRLVVSLI